MAEDIRVRNQRARARSVGMTATLTLQEWEQTVAHFNGLCAYCQERPYEVVEHFLPVYVAGTHVGNCLPACYKCNYKKNDHTGAILADLFGQATIDRLINYLTSRTTTGILPFTEPPKRKARSTRKKRDKKFIPPYIEEQAVYPIQDLYNQLTFSHTELAQRCGVSKKQISRVIRGHKVYPYLADRLLRELSAAYGKTFTLQNVSGINIRVNKSLERYR